MMLTECGERNNNKKLFAFFFCPCSWLKKRTWVIYHKACGVHGNTYSRCNLMQSIYVFGIYTMARIYKKCICVYEREAQREWAKYTEIWRWHGELSTSGNWGLAHTSADRAASISAEEAGVTALLKSTPALCLALLSCGTEGPAHTEDTRKSNQETLRIP